PLSGLPLRDPVSCLTHLAGCLLAAYAALLLLRLAGDDRAKRVSLLVFGVSAVLLYAASAAYHAVPLPRESPTVGVFRRLAHSAGGVGGRPVLGDGLDGRRPGAGARAGDWAKWRGAGGGRGAVLYGRRGV